MTVNIRFGPSIPYSFFYERGRGTAGIDLTKKVLVMKNRFGGIHYAKCYGLGGGSNSAEGKLKMEVEGKRKMIKFHQKRSKALPKNTLYELQKSLCAFRVYVHWKNLNFECKGGGDESLGKNLK